MIQLMTLMEGQYDYGCVMAYPDEASSKKFLTFNHSLIDESILYKEEESFGRENEPHVTIKYGLVKPYSEEQMRQLLHHVTPFNIEVGGLSVFENENFDVIKFEVDSKELRKLNELFCKLPNHDSYPEYKPHMTLAYVQKGHGKRFAKESLKKTKIPITSIVYSHKGNKWRYDLYTKQITPIIKKELTEGEYLDNITAKIQALENEWERLNNAGIGTVRQAEISRELQSLELQKKHWESMYSQTKIGEGNLNSISGRYVGIIDPYGAVLMPSGQNGERFHGDFGWSHAHNRWAYWPREEKVSWWDDPSQDDMMKVEDFLTRKKYNVKKHTSAIGTTISPALLSESIIPPVILGAINAAHEVEAIKGVNDDSRHPFKYNTWLKWRYVPDIHYLSWWEPPTEMENEMVRDYLERHGYKVRRVNIMTRRMEENVRPEKTGLGQFGPYDDIQFSWIPNADYRGTEHSTTFPYSSGRRFRFYFGNSDKDGMVYWVTSDPTPDEIQKVDDFFNKLGIKVQQRDYKLHILKENLIMEVTQQQADAALAFLEEKVKTGPFKSKVYLAGGPVRDLIMGRTPKDLDVSVIGDGLRGGLNFAIWLAKEMGNYKGPSVYPPQFNFPAHIQLDDYGAPTFSPRGEPENPDPELVKALEEYDAYYASFSNPVLFPKFGTAKVFLQGSFNGVNLSGMDVEAVAARKEIYTPGSRKPKVYAGTLKDDVFRRDFRANSLMKDLTTGQVLDLTGEGINDIKKGILVTTSDPEVIFREDPLRMMRAVRFMVQKGFQISPETKENIRKNAHWLKSISRERVRDELDKMLVSPNPTAAIRELRDLGLLQYISSDLQKAVGMTQNIHHKHDVFDHTMEVLKNTKPELVQRLMALFHDIGKVATRSETPSGVHFYGHEKAGADMVEKILHGLKYPSDIINAVRQGVSNHMRLKQGGDTTINLSDKTLRKFKIDLGDNLENILDVIHADNIAHADASAMPNQIKNVRQRLQALDVQVKKPVLPINGNDLFAMGIKAGPQMGKILSAVTDAWFENPNITRDEALAIVRQMT